MRKTIAPAEMKRVETFVMEHTAITGESLMHKAAAHVAQAVQSYAQGGVRTVLCLCGTGNNGGDGMAAMRILARNDPDFQGECWMLPGTLSPDAVRELDALSRTQVTIRRLEGKLIYISEFRDPKE